LKHEGPQSERTFRQGNEPETEDAAQVPVSLGQGQIFQQHFQGDRGLKPGKGELFSAFPVLNTKGQFSGLSYSEAEGIGFPEKPGVIVPGIVPVVQSLDSQFGGHDPVFRNQNLKGTQRQGTGALGEKKKFHRGPASPVGGGPPPHGTDLGQYEGVRKNRRVYLYLRRPGMIRQNGDGPDMIYCRIFRDIFQPDLRRGFGGGKKRRGKADEKKAKPEAPEPAGL
jgi:hypothetical protein